MANSHGWTQLTPIATPAKSQDAQINASVTTGKSSHATHPSTPFTSNGPPAARQHGDLNPNLGVAPSRFFATI